MLTAETMDRTYQLLGIDAISFLPELLLCLAIVWMLLLRVFTRSKSHLGWTALLFTGLALLVSLGQWAGPVNLPGLGTVDMLGPPDSGESPMFGALLVYDTFTIFLRIFLFASTMLVIWMTLLTGIPDREDSSDFYCLLLGATLGMALMASSNHLLMVFLAVEMASLPSYALAGFLKGRQQSSEAALKYVVYGGGASGIMLYGISLIVGKLGTGFLPNVAAGYAVLLTSGAGQFDPILVLGTLFILIGLAFKLSAVPFHFWCPDVFEGAAAEVAGFLSVASKGAAFALLARFGLGLAGLVDKLPVPHTSDPVSTLATWLIPGLVFFAAVTATFGNLAAYLQTNLKRLLAYSTIAHAGYMLMGIAALTREGAAAVLFYLVTYVVTNLGAFAVVAFLRNKTGSEELDSYRGLVRKSPVLVVALAFFLLSLLGMPPLAGFAAKFQIFSVLYRDGQFYAQAGHITLGYLLIGLLVLGGLNTVLSVVYYLKVLKVMIIDAPPEEAAKDEVKPLGVSFGATAYASVLAAAVLVLGILWGPLSAAADRGTQRFRELKKPGTAEVAQGVREGMGE